MNLFRGFAVILIVWYGVRAALSSAQGGPGLNLGQFASLLLSIAFGFTMVTYYARPIPGFGVSFTHLITDQAINLANTLEVNAIQEVQTRLTSVYVGMEQPSMLDVSQIIRYYITIFALTMAQLAVLAVIAYGYVATGVKCSSARSRALLVPHGMAVLGLARAFQRVFRLSQRLRPRIRRLILHFSSASVAHSGARRALHADKFLLLAFVYACEGAVVERDLHRAIWGPRPPAMG
jgi:hypothetical protein